MSPLEIYELVNSIVDIFGWPMIIIVHGSILAPSSNNWAALVGGHG
jgi:hypothetical protein